MPVSILLVRVSQGREGEATEGILRLENTEITQQGNGFLVAATHSINAQNDLNTINNIQGLEHVLEVSLVMTADENAM